MAMRTTIRNHFTKNNVFVMECSKGYISSNSSSVVTHPSSPSQALSHKSPKESSDVSSEIAAEIVVWTEDMDLSGLTNNETEDSSLRHLSTE